MRHFAQAQGADAVLWEAVGLLHDLDYEITVDELSGFVLAVARVRPSKSIHEVDVASVKKKMKDKAFARAVNRDDIVRGAAELGRPQEEVIAGVIVALQGDAERLGLGGDPKPDAAGQQGG